MPAGDAEVEALGVEEVEGPGVDAVEESGAGAVEVEDAEPDDDLCVVPAGAFPLPFALLSFLPLDLEDLELDLGARFRWLLDGMGGYALQRSGLRERERVA